MTKPHTGAITLPTGGENLLPNRRVKIEGGVAVYAGALDNDIGVTQVRVNQPPSANVSVDMVQADGTVLMESSGAVTKYALVYGGTDGRVSATPNANLIGTALTSASGAGSYIEVARTVVQASPGDLASSTLAVVDDDFNETWPAAGSAITLPFYWAKAETNGLGVTSRIENGGVLRAAFDTTVEAALAAFYGATVNINVNKAPIFEARVRVTDEGNNAALNMYIGLASSYNATFASIAQIAYFQIKGDDLSIWAASKDGTTTVAATDTTVDAANDAWVDLKIDATDKTDVKFFVNGARVLTATTFALDYTGFVTPIVYVQKSSNATPAILDVDRIRVIANR